MKKILLGTVALVALGMSTSAFAADLRGRAYTKAPPPPPAPIYNWTGFYIGGHIGAAFRGNNNAFFGGSNDARFIGGGQVGADYQFAQSWVVGIEANYSAMGNNNGNFNRGLASVTGRLGYAWGPALLYAKGGYAYADTRNVFGFGNPNRDGYTVGGGLEYMFAPSWSVKAEYQYYDLGRNAFIFVPVVGGPFGAGNFRNEEHTVKVGINYRFGWGGPVVARY